MKATARRNVICAWSALGTGVALLACSGAKFEADVERASGSTDGGDVVGDATFEDVRTVVVGPPQYDAGAEDDATSGDGEADAPTGDGASASCGADASTQYCGAGVGCVDTTSSPTNCNTCGNACPVPANGTATCVASTCGIACDSGHFLCDSTCHSDNAPPTDACVVTEQFGVFVAPGGTGTGTRAAPFGSIQAGLAAAQTQGLGRVYVCGGTLAGAVAFTASSAAVTVYGGFQCGSWTYAPTTQHVVVAPPSGVPLTFNGSAAAIAIENIEFDAANATGFDAHGNGNSSIAAFAVNATNVSLVGVTLKAGNGVSAGAAAAPASNYGGGATAPSGEGPALLDAGVTTPGSITCTDGTSSRGGGGGESAAAAGGVLAGGIGSSVPATTPSPSTPLLDGAGGAAGTTTAGCGNGYSGANGAANPAVAGAATWGTLTSSGWTPTGGSNGSNGNPGQGGGGGGGSTPAPAGGSGGSGGCGGTGGLAGVGGGSSFALLSLNSTIALTGSCTLSAGNAGAGGGGGNGENGQNGGAQGLSSCSGGYGGNGAGGGGGGGGAAGVSAGIGYVGTSTPTADSTTSYALGTVSGASGGGAGGNGGTTIEGSGPAGNAGGTGIAGKSQDVLPL